VLELFGHNDGTMAHMGLSDMLAIDLDRHPGGADGVENFKNFARTSGLKWPATLVHASSGNGRHVFFRQNPSCPLGTSHGRLAGGIDIKAGVALVRMPPTPGYMRLKGNSVAMIPLATAQELARLTMTEPKRARTDGVTGTQAHSIGGLTMSLANARQGTRNDVLHWALCRAAEMPAGKQRSALRALRHEARMIGLGDTEIEKTITSVFGGRRG
jgi:hypothetical protein